MFILGYLIGSVTVIATLALLHGASEHRLQKDAHKVINQLESQKEYYQEMATNEPDEPMHQDDIYAVDYAINLIREYKVIG